MYIFHLNLIAFPRCYKVPAVTILYGSCLDLQIWVGWVSEIKYGLIAAARGAFTSLRPISLKRIVNRHET